MELPGRLFSWLTEWMGLFCWSEGKDSRLFDVASIIATKPTDNWDSLLYIDRWSVAKGATSAGKTMHSCRAKTGNRRKMTRRVMSRMSL